MRFTERLSIVKVTIEELSNETNFGWKENIFQPLLNGWNLSLPEIQITVNNLEHLTEMIDLLNRTPEKTVEHYVGWYRWLVYSQYSNELERQLYMEFMNQTMGQPEQSERWYSCHSLVSSHLKMSIARLFVEESFSYQKHLQVSPQCFNPI